MNLFTIKHMIGLVLTLCIATSLVSSMPTFPDKIPNGRNVIDGRWPGVGHMNSPGGGPLNPFGMDFRRAGFQWTQNLCQQDSDGDGLTNGRELGDPFCVWKPGDTPNRTHHITHPGFKEGEYPPIGAETCNDVPEDPSAYRVNMTMSSYKIPEKTTTYTCQRFDMPEQVLGQANHIIRWDPIIVRRDIVHHLIVFVCSDKPPTTEPWECGLEMPSGCKEFVWGWAAGGLHECIPAEAGIPVGQNGPSFFVIQMHYNNELHVPDAIDSSGVSMQLTPKLRQFDASVLLNGAAESDIHIPPRLAQFQVISDCPSFCTSQAFPEDGIFIYAYLMHMHLLGKKMWTELIKPNGEKSILGIVPVYDFNAQAWVPIDPPIKLSRGDRLITHCQYGSLDRNETTNGGASTDMEMCTANLAYFPRVPGLDLCTNYTDDDGRKMGRCANFDFDWESHKTFPTCEPSDIPPQASVIHDEVLPLCKDGSQCSDDCKDAILDWASTSSCVKRNGLKLTLGYCGQYQADCDAFKRLFAQPCLKLCYSDQPNGDADCPRDFKCSDFTCSAPGTNQVILIATLVTAGVIVVIIVGTVIFLTKCHKIRRKVEYIN